MIKGPRRRGAPHDLGRTVPARTLFVDPQALAARSAATWNSDDAVRLHSSREELLRKLPEALERRLRYQIGRCVGVGPYEKQELGAVHVPKSREYRLIEEDCADASS
jgi:hypothetical protein